MLLYLILTTVTQGPGSRHHGPPPYSHSVPRGPRAGCVPADDPLRAALGPSGSHPSPCRDY